MANPPRGGKRLAGSSPAKNYQGSSPYNFSNTDPAARSDEDAVIDEILRSIAGVEFNITSAPNRTLQEPPRRTALPRSRMSHNPPPREPEPEPQPQPQPAPQQPKANTARRQVIFPQSSPAQTRENEYQAAAASIARQQAQQARPAPQPVQAPEEAPETPASGLRDTQVFRPARPAKRDTDRLPTLVDDEPRKGHPILSKLLTLVVILLVLAALVLGTKMLYILGPSMGLDLPDLSNVPVISSILGMIPDAEVEPMEMPTEADENLTEEALPDPTSVTLDADDLTLSPGDTRVLTATLDVEGWQGLLAWASSDKSEEVIKLTVLGPNTAQVEYRGEGKCAVAVQVGVTPEDGSSPPHATCYIECVADEEEFEEPEEFETDADTGTEDGGESAEAVNIVLKKDDFTLKVGEGYQLADSSMDPNAVTWTTSDEGVATVSAGNVYAIAAGNATITATSPDGTSMSATCRVKDGG